MYTILFIFFIGFLYFFRGLGDIVGPFLVGTLYDVTKSYDYGCYMSAASLFLASILNEMAHFSWKKHRKN